MSVFILNKCDYFLFKTVSFYAISYGLKLLVKLKCIKLWLIVAGKGGHNAVGGM